MCTGMTTDSILHTMESNTLKTISWKGIMDRKKDSEERINSREREGRLSREVRMRDSLAES
jgi:hypothetical protein